MRLAHRRSSPPRDSRSSNRIPSCKRVFSLKHGLNGSGSAVLSAWQKSSGTLLASAEDGNPTVFIHNRQGHIHQQITLSGSCTGMSWDEDGDFLAIMCEGTSVIYLWESHSKRLTEIESNIKDPGTCICWSKVGKILAYTTSKGNILIYNHRTLRKVPIIGKHTKRIVCAAWSNDSVLALGTIDYVMSINTMDGDAIKTIQLRARPSDLKFGQIKEDQSNPGVDNTVSVIVGDKTLYLLKLEETSQVTPLELGFQSRYGNIVSHHWHGDGYILASFSAGFIVMISSHHREIGTELILTELKNEPLRCTALCNSISKIAVCFGDNDVEIRDAADPNNIISMADLEEEGRIRPAVRCQWSDDGQLLALLTSVGDLHIYLTAVPLLGDAGGPYVVQMSSLTDLVLHSFQEHHVLVEERILSLEVEPSLVAVGPFNFCAALNNRVWYYSIAAVVDNMVNTPVMVKEYNSNVHEVSLNGEYAACRCGEKLFLHLIEGDGLEEKDIKTFPEASPKGFNRVICQVLTKDCLIYGGDNGIVKIFHLEAWREVHSFIIPTKVALKRIIPDFLGANLILIDKNNEGFSYDIPQDSIRPIPHFPSRCDGVLWDYDDKSKHIFLTHSRDRLTVNVFLVWHDVSLGQEILSVGEFEVFQSLEQKPLCLRDGVIHSQNSSGRLSKTISFYLEQPGDRDATAGQKNKLGRLLTLKKFPEAIAYCNACNDTELWSVLARAALESMEIEIAIEAYLMLDNPGMVLSLEEVLVEEDWQLTVGHIALILGDFDMAEKSYLNSSQKYAALHMRCDLQQWESALTLAHDFAPEHICEVAREYATHQEADGNYLHALQLFEDAYKYSNGPPEGKGYLNECEAGLARNCIRCGQLKRGSDLALNLQFQEQKKQCAEIMEGNKYYNDAANLFEHCAEWDRAASLYIRLKDWNRVTAILPNIQSQKIFLQYAKAKESEGSLQDAAYAYEQAGDAENACKLYTAADNADAAIRIAKKSGNLAGCLIIARYFEKHNDIDTAIRFLLLSKCHQDAVTLAFKNGKAELFATIAQEISEEANPTGKGVLEEFKPGIKEVAAHFDGLKDSFKAGKYFLLAGNPTKAFKVLMKASQTGILTDEAEVIALLTEATVAVNDEASMRYFIEYLLGEKDGYPKDPKYLLNLYISARRLGDASKTALIVSLEEQKNGNYKSAHKTLVTTCLELRSQKTKTPRDIMEMLSFLHFYMLVRTHILRGSHDTAARLLIQLANTVERFPKHAVQLLTTTVIECQKANLKASAMNTCYTLMKPEYRSQIDPKYKQRFENMVRKSGKVELEDAPDQTSPCPYCQFAVSNFQLGCPECRANIPFCFATGRHIIVEDLTACPSCEFPAIRTELLKLTESDGKTIICPICETNLFINDIAQINDPRPYLNAVGTVQE